MAKSAEGRSAPRSKSADPMGDAVHDRLSDLDDRIGKVRGKHAGPQTQSQNERSAAMGTAMRLGTELIAGSVVGGFIGWQLDQWLETTPFLLLTFFVLGSVAGIFNVIRTAYRLQPRPGKPTPPGPAANDR